MIPLIILVIENPDDRDFMGELYLSYKRLMYSEIQKITRDSWATEDIIQSALEKLIDKIPLLRTLSKSKLINYIISTSRNTAINYLRKKNQTPEFSYDDEFDSIADYAIGMEDNIILRDLIENAKAAWRALDMRSKEILELRFMLDKSNSEIANELGIQPDSVRMAISRARKKFKEKATETEME